MVMLSKSWVGPLTSWSEVWVTEVGAHSSVTRVVSRASPTRWVTETGDSSPATEAVRVASYEKHSCTESAGIW